MRSAVLRFAVVALGAFCVLVVGTVMAANRIAEHRALDEARDRGAGLATRLVAPLIDEPVRADQPGAAARLETVMRNRMADGSLLHVKIWDADGTIIWSDESNLVGRKFALDRDVAVLFGTTRVTAEVSDLSRPENAGERVAGYDELLEVYAGAFDADGQPLVVEAYSPTDQMDQDAASIRRTLVPVAVAGLTLLLVAMMPLAVLLGRRVQRAERAESRAVRRSLLASDLERRRIAADLHDGVVQDLAGLGYALPTIEGELREDGDFETARNTLATAAGLVHRDVEQLRSLMTDLYPPDLSGGGLEEALEELLQNVEAKGVDTHLAVASGPPLPEDVARLVYRVVREGLANVVKHAGASRVQVEVGRLPGYAIVRVLDDGRGPGPGPTTSEEEGHFGLRLLADAVGDVGGDLEVGPGSTGGTLVVARIPLRLTPEGDAR